MKRGWKEAISIVLAGCVAAVVGMAVEPATIERALEAAVSDQSGATAVGVKTVGDGDILSVDLQSGTRVEIDPSDWTIIRRVRPLFARRQRRVGRAVESIGPMGFGLAEAYRSVLENEENAEISTDTFDAVEYILHRERVLIRVSFTDVALYLNPETGDFVDL